MSRWNEDVPVSDMLGATLASAMRVDDGEIRFVAVDGRTWVMDHSQDCCESVTIESINGDLSDLVGVPLTLAEETESPIPEGHLASDYDSETWTFYRFATCKGHVDIRWHGTSNGYYSESVDFRLVAQ